MRLAFRQVDRAPGPDLKWVYPRIVGLGRRQGHVFAEVAYGRAFGEVGDAIGKERDLLAILGRDLGMDVELNATIGTDVDVVELFEFDYQLEMYKPAARRRWGYFALPILYGDQLVGKLDATADRKAGVLRVDAIHQDVPFDTTMTAEVEGEIEDLAGWLELDLTLPRPSRLAGGTPAKPGRGL